MKKKYVKPEVEVINFIAEETIADDIPDMSGGVGDVIGDEG